MRRPHRVEIQLGQEEIEALQAKNPEGRPLAVCIREWALAYRG